MKYTSIIVSSVLIGFSALAETIVLEGVSPDVTTTGNLINGTRDVRITTNVCEVPGLMISAWSGSAEQKINVTSTSLGINTDNIADITDAFEAGEALFLSFNKTLTITQFDFNRFESNETFCVLIGSNQLIEIEYDLLTNKVSDYFNTNVVVSADTEIKFYVTGESIIGLDGLTVSLAEETNQNPVLSITFSNGLAMVSVEFNEAVATDYFLQCRPDFSESNDWVNASAAFKTNSSWQIETTNDCGFYRAISP